MFLNIKCPQNPKLNIG